MFFLSNYNAVNKIIRPKSEGLKASKRVRNRKPALIDEKSGKKDYFFYSLYAQT